MVYLLLFLLLVWSTQNYITCNKFADKANINQQDKYKTINVVLKILNIGQYKEPQYTNGKYNIFSKISKLHVFLHHLDTKCYQRKRIIINLLISILKNTMKESKFTWMKYVNYLGMILFKDILSCNDFVFILHFAIHYNSQNNESDYFSSKTLSKLPWKWNSVHCMEVSYMKTLTNAFCIQ